MTRPIFYLHLPKTGGQTLANRLASAFALDRSHILRGDIVFPRDTGLLNDLLANRDFVEAHVAGPILVEATAADILCTVRDPVARIVSSYMHVRREPENRLHRAAHALRPAEFFRHYAAHWCNQQSRSLIEAVIPPGEQAVLEGSSPDWLHANLLPALARIRWLVPTEVIDEFVLLWARETGHHVPAAGLVVNVAPPDPLDQAALHRIVAAMPEIYDLDLALWVRARRWMADYRRRVTLQGVDPRSPATLAFSRDEEAIWLTEGWLMPSRDNTGALEWWAGPCRVSRLSLRRRHSRTLTVDVSVVNGIRRDEIAAFTAADRRPLPCHLEGENGTLLSIDLEGLGDEAEVLIAVPEVLTSIEVSSTDTDTTLRSFAGRNWRLE